MSPPRFAVNGSGVTCGKQTVSVGSLELKIAIHELPVILGRRRVTAGNSRLSIDVEL